ncbi:choline transporter-like 2 isoform X4 [Spodoptera frugiperda]|uniref:Choline transporter-like protein n=1 Tax=Spodoptera frugiperda TaxID=7108 RepID=A0A9R0DUJ2_SPOFR|nr:choline transporter-like 2 isoform X4 [Spodoptera frugiperda]XP_050553345.1 choline transporter-like 2 isoform X4 [Spodoptera frugiperda]
MGKDYGEPIRYDPNFNGPIHNRSCTDIFWLVLFVLFLGVWGYVGYYGMTHGNIEKLLAPIDTFGARCGLDSSVKDKPYLVFFDISKCLSPGTPIVGCPTPQVCVSKCPSRTIIFASEMNQQNFDTYRSSMVCTYDVNVNTISYSQAVEYMANGKCAPYVLESQAVMGRCFVNVADVKNILQNVDLTEEEVISQIVNLVQFQELSAQIVQDLVQSRWYLLGAVFGVVVLCFLYILLLRWVVGPVVWVSIVGLIGLLGFCVYLCYKNYAYYKANPGLLHQTTNLKGYAESMFTKPGTWMAILIAVAIVLLILVLMVIFLRKRISIAIAIIREGSKAVTAVKSTIFFPLFPWMFQCFVIAYGVLVLMYLLSIGDSAFKIVNLQNDTTCSCSNGVYSQDYQSCDPVTFLSHCFDSSGGSCKQAMCHFTGLENPHSVVYLHLANLLGFFWTMFFISGVSDMMLASTFSTWYWTYDKKDLPFFTLTSGIYRTVRFHLGTVAFGALIIAIVRVIRVILEYIDQKLKKFDNPVTKCLMCLCKCFCWCLENFLKFINKNAYIMCAVHGQNFCTSARDAFSLLMRNILRVVVIDKVTDFLFFLSKLLISIGVGVGVYYLLQWNLLYEVTKGQPLHYNHIPAIILSIATYLICTIFFNVYEMAVDTLFLCFLEDCERNDGSPEKPYFMSKNLMRILGKRNKEL